MDALDGKPDNLEDCTIVEARSIKVNLVETKTAVFEKKRIRK